MTERKLKPRLLNPLTPAGVARFAHAPLGKVLSICFVFATVVGAAVIWLSARCWAPVIDDAARALPTNSVIEAGQLFWPEKSMRLLGENEFLSIEVNPEGEKMQSKPTDIALIFEPYGLRVGSLFGYSFLPYPQRWVVQMNRDGVVPAWGAWQPAIIAGLGILTALTLMICWGILAVFYAFYPWLVAALFKRDLFLHQAWKLSCAAMAPGSILMAFGLILYLLDEIGLVFFLLLGAAHFVIGWFYIFLASFYLKKAEVQPDQNANPFQPEKASKRARSKNPFSMGDAE